MLITNDFEVAQPVAAVWDFFGDIPRVASCLPGAELTGLRAITSTAAGSPSGWGR